MGHTPVTAYDFAAEKNVIAEVTFRYGPMKEQEHQCFRIALDHRQRMVGHVLSAWANPNNDFIETGLLLQHIEKDNEKKILKDLLLDHQPLNIEPEEWQTAILEVSGNEALFRLNDHVAYANALEIGTEKTKVSLTFGTCWHEVKRVRVWRAKPSSTWTEAKISVLSKRQPFEAQPHNYKKSK